MKYKQIKLIPNSVDCSANYAKYKRYCAEVEKPGISITHRHVMMEDYFLRL